MKLNSKNLNESDCLFSVREKIAFKALITIENKKTKKLISAIKPKKKHAPDRSHSS
ncbi:hypothetical protein ABW387_07665 [Snodgrassella alvi]|uniref:hypothetical protein n=1 Tax=Snodgrassella TaxID=1193515 RepID=UPI0018DE1646|nr:MULTISPECIES: hypothetical protein [Snodgrassella]MBI0165372.1 hypothetical protein [Snodgrassella sp. M0351]WLT01875.1 hypothetical protein RAM00_08445 [Snodgrassella alvi]